MTQPTRRTLVRTAVWTGPAVAVTAAAPAFATSGAPRLTFNPGTTSVIQSPYFDVQFQGASITVSGTAPAATLSLSVTFIPTAGPTTLWATGQAPAGWSAPNEGPWGDPLPFTYSTPVSGGDTIHITDGVYFGTYEDPQLQTGPCLLSFKAGDFETATYTVSTDSAGPAAQTAGVRVGPRTR
jgi:hypothetical protein